MKDKKLPPSACRPPPFADPALFPGTFPISMGKGFADVSSLAFHFFLFLQGFSE
jgi:hypothetical protein